MIRTVFADTGPLLAAIDSDDQYHRRAQADLERLVEEGIGVLVANSALLETYSLVLRRVGVVGAHRWLGELRRDVEIVIPTVDDLDEAVDLVERYRDQPISLFDAVLAVLADQADIPIWTYDYHFDLMRVTVWR